MPPLQVKDFPNHVYERLRDCARQENRSISQQTLTIIEDYLNMRDRGLLPSRARGTIYIPSHTSDESKVDRAERRRKAIEYIDSHLLPGNESMPSTVELIRSIREEEAR